VQYVRSGTMEFESVKKDGVWHVSQNSAAVVGHIRLLALKSSSRSDNDGVWTQEFGELEGESDKVVFCLEIDD
jgi:hypothetical protein